MNYVESRSTREPFAKHARSLSQGLLLDGRATAQRASLETASSIHFQKKATTNESRR